MPLIALPGGRKPDPRRDALRSALRVRHLRLAALDDLRATIVDEICRLEDELETPPAEPVATNDEELAERDRQYAEIESQAARERLAIRRVREARQAPAEDKGAR